MKKVTIIIAALAMVASFALSASAAEWNFYGSARIQVASVDYDSALGKDDRETEFKLLGTSRIGAKVKVSDTLVGRFEYGTGVNLRHLYAEWNFGAGKLLVGQSYTPTGTYFYSNQAWNDDGLFEYGGIQYHGRLPMLRLTFGDLKLALVEFNTDNSGNVTGAVKTTLPKIEAAYNMKFDNFFVDISGGYQSYEKGNTDIDSYLVALGGGVDIGAFYVKGNVYYAQNGEAYGLLGMGQRSVEAKAINDTNDMETLSACAILGYKMSDAITFETGYGYQSHELDDTAPGQDSDDEAIFYLQAAVTLAPGVRVIPEFGFIDLDDTDMGVDEGDITYFAAKWQIDF